MSKFIQNFSFLSSTELFHPPKWTHQPILIFSLGISCFYVLLKPLLKILNSFDIFPSSASTAYER